MNWFYFILSSFITFSKNQVYESTPFIPTKIIPKECYNQKIVDFISSNILIDFNSTNHFDSSQPSKCYSWNEYTAEISIEPTCFPEINKNYVWKELSNSPLIGITYGIISEHLPHYHNEDECYYVWKGNTKTLANNNIMDIEVGDYLYIPSNHIHTTPILYNDFGVIYWFPNYYLNNTSSKPIKYYWKHNCPRKYKHLFPE